MTQGDVAPARITLISRVDCHLCDVARATIERVASELSASWVELDVDADPELLRKYSDQVPVTLVDGRQHDFWRVDSARLRAALGAP
ncbi:MAG: glutaredoxin family protein [Angustibacter sp.]